MSLRLFFVFMSCISFVFCAYNSGLCGHVSKSCTHQLWPHEDKPEDACRMIYYNKTTDDCVNQRFTENYNPIDYGYVKIEPFFDQSRTAFNISLYDLKWTTFKMRFKQRGHHLNMCRDFRIAENEVVSNESILFYDCPFSTAAYENRIVSFEYGYGVNNLVGKKFVFTVPKHENIDADNISMLHLFVYVDCSDLNNLILRMKEPPKEFNITSYFVRVLRTKNNETEKCHEKNVSNTDAKFGEIQYLYKTNGIHGKYYFEVIPNHPFCREYHCNRIKSPGVNIPKNTTPQTIAIVSVSILLVPVLLFVFYIWKKQCLKDGELFRDQQKILLVYSPSNDAHFNVVKALAGFLIDAYKTNVMIDIHHVPFTKTKDPFIWFQDAFIGATHIVFLLSPTQTDCTKSIYKDIDNLAIHLMKQELSKPTKKIFSVLIFPYSQSPMPVELSNLKQFYFKRDFDGFLNFLLRKNFWEKLEERVHILKPELYIKLQEAVKIAENNAENENNCEGAVKTSEFILQKDESRIIRLTNDFVQSDERPDNHHYLYDIQEVLENEGRSESEVPDDECTTFDVRDLNLDGD